MHSLLAKQKGAKWISIHLNAVLPLAARGAPK